MNGKRSIYVALTSLASPNEELNVLSTAAEQEKKTLQQSVRYKTNLLINDKWTKKESKDNSSRHLR